MRGGADSRVAPWAGFVLLRSLLNRLVTVPDRHFNNYPCRILYD